jgi:hypothetical protein
MRGGFVAGVHADGARVADAATRLRWHRGQPAQWDHRGLHVAGYTDAREGPVFERLRRGAMLLHGAVTSPDEARTAGDRFVTLEWDGAVLSVTRDPLGQVPLFVRPIGGTLWLATEVEPLVAVAPASVERGPLVLNAACMAFPDRTGWCEIRRVLPGHTTVFLPDGTVIEQPYWEPRALLGTFRGGRDDAIAELRTRFADAVRDSWVYGAAVALSGGLDSTAIAITAPRGAVRLVHARFPTAPEADEETFARAVAEHVGSPLVTVTGDTSPWDPDVELAQLGLPYSWLPYGVDEPVFAGMADAGAGVALDGHDGDGMLGVPGGEWGELLRTRAFASLLRHARRDGCLRTVQDVAAELRWHPRAVTYAKATQRYFHARVPRLPALAMDRQRPFTRWRVNQLQALAPSSHMEVKELIAARHDVDLRHPFADRQLVEFLISLPCSIKSDPGRSKPLLRDALGTDLPAAVRDRASNARSVLHRRVDATECAERIRVSGVRFPLIDYDRLFADAECDPAAIPMSFIVNLTRAHVFVAQREPVLIAA